MKLWLDAQLSPRLARWLVEQFAVDASPLREFGLREHGPPPRVVWLRCGNTSEARLREILLATLPRVLSLLDDGEASRTRLR